MHERFSSILPESTLLLGYGNGRGVARLVAKEEAFAQAERLSSEGLNVGVSPHEVSEESNKADAVAKPRVVWLDDDAGKLGDLPLPPTFRIETSPGRWHVGWRVDSIPRNRFNQVSRALAERFGTDPVQISKTIRMPGFLNVNKGSTVRLLECSPERVYRWDEFMEAFQVEAKKKATVSLGDWIELTEDQAEDFADLLKPHFKKGQRDTLATAWAGCCAKARIDEGSFLDVLRKVQDAKGDDEPEARHTKWRNAVRKIERGGPDTVSGLMMAREISEGLQASLKELLDAATKERREVQPLAGVKRLPSAVELYYLLEPRFNIEFDITGACWREWNGFWWPEVSLDDARRAVWVALEDLGAAHFTMRVINEVLSFAAAAKRRAFEHPSDMIAFGHIMTGGVADTREGSFRPWDEIPEDELKQIGLTWALPFGWPENSDCPRFTEFLQKSVGADMLPFMRAMVRCILSREYGLQVLYLLTGEGGDGKGVFMRLLSELLGGETNVASTSLDALKTQFEIANLYGKSLVLLPDDRGFTSEPEILKRITGNEPLRGERKREQRPVTFTFEGSLMLSTNEATLRSCDLSGAMTRRIRQVRFSRGYQRRDLFFLDKLLPELPAIARWALEMDRDEALDLVDDPGRHIARYAKMERERRMEANPIVRWMAEELTPSRKGFIQIGQRLTDRSSPTERRMADHRLYPRYVEWCETQAFKPLTVAAFTNALPNAFNELGWHVDRRKLRRTGGLYDGVPQRWGFWGVQFREAELEQGHDGLLQAVK
ncbi:MAG: DUF5906 domain-containing protein [Methylohalobius sp. ZOD2]